MIAPQVQFTAAEQAAVAGAVTAANGKYHRSILQGIEMVVRQRAGCEV